MILMESSDKGSAGSGEKEEVEVEAKEEETWKDKAENEVEEVEEVSPVRRRTTRGGARTALM